MTENTRKSTALSKNQQVRLDYIDYRLYFFGRVTRGDIQQRFSVKGAAATRDLRLYKDIYPDNITYDNQQKTYHLSDSYKKPKDRNFEEILENLNQDNLIASVNDRDSPPVTQLSQHHQPNLEVLAILVRAISFKSSIVMGYISLSSGLSSREILPLAVVDSGVRWHLRAFDRRNQRFADFVINRITTIDITNSPPSIKESLVSDKQWNRFVTLRLVPHPKLDHAEAIEFEYAMSRGFYVVDIRAALVGYFLRFWNVDSSEDHSLEVPDSYLWLSNSQTLYDVDNLAIAPGRKG
jgi:WYL domain-containing protein